MEPCTCRYGPPLRSFGMTACGGHFHPFVVRRKAHSLPIRERGLSGMAGAAYTLVRVFEVVGIMATTITAGLQIFQRHLFAAVKGQLRAVRSVKTINE